MDPVTAQLAMSLVAQGMRFWADRSDRIAAGTLTDAELDEMAAKLGADMDGLRADIAAARAAKAAAGAAPATP